MDEVDELVAAWRRERPDLDLEPMQVWSRIARLAQLLSAVRAEAFEAQDLQIWEFDVLAALRREGPPCELSPGELIHQTLSSSGTMTNRIDRLAARGLVERLPDPRDRRGVRVRLLTPGRELVEAALADLLEREQHILDGLSLGEREQIAALLRRLVQPFEADPA